MKSLKDYLTKEENKEVDRILSDDKYLKYSDDDDDEAAEEHVVTEEEATKLIQKSFDELEELRKNN